MRPRQVILAMTAQRRSAITSTRHGTLVYRSPRPTIVPGAVSGAALSRAASTDARGQIHS